MFPLFYFMEIRSQNSKQRAFLPLRKFDASNRKEKEISFSGHALDRKGGGWP
jgi:hypothetical protein